MLRKTAISLAVAGILSATQAHALSIGDIRVKSALNEPLDAEIRLTDTKGLRPLQIQPDMADIDEFALAGLNKSRFLSDIKFAVKLNRDGTGVLRMTSSLPVQEPFLNFLIEVNWPNGRLVREYTVLLDPPVFDPTPARQAAQASLPMAASQGGSNARKGRGTGQQTDRVIVDARDTLWALAIKHRVAPGISSQQMMMALQKKNPTAFRNNNINQLKRGAALRLPTPAEARAMSTREAIAEIARQTAAWKAGRQVAIKEAPKAAPVDVSSKVTAPVMAPKQPEAPAEKSDQLKIVSAPPAATADKPDDAAEKKSDGAVSDQSPLVSEDLNKLSQRNEELEQQLAATLEDVDRIERDNADMNDRLDAVQQQLDALQRMLELKDQQLAALQAELDETRAQIPPPPPPEKSLMETLTSSPLYWGSALGALLLAIGGAVFAFLRRRKEETAVDDDAPLEPASAGLVSVPDELEAEVEPAADDDEFAVAEDDDDDDGTEQISDEALDAMEDLDEMSDLDLDMDLDLDPDGLDEDVFSEVESSGLEVDAGADIPTVEELGDEIRDEEFDLGIDDALDGLDLDVDQPADNTELVDGLDSMMEPEKAVEASDDLDMALDVDDSVADLADDESNELDGLDIDQLLTDNEVESDDGGRDAPSSVVADDDIDSLLDSMDDGLDAIADADDIDSLLDSVEAEPEAVADADDIDSLLDSMGVEPNEIADADDIDGLLDSVEAESEAVADTDDIDSLLDSVEAEPEAVADADDIDSLLDSVEAEPEAVADADDIDSLLDSVEAEPEAVADADDIDSLLDSVEAEPEAVADVDDIDSLLDSVEAEPEAVADADDIDSLLDSVEAEPEAVADADDIDSLLDSVEAEPEAVEDEDDIDSLLDSMGDELDQLDVASEESVAESESAPEEVLQSAEIDEVADLESELDDLLAESDAPEGEAATDKAELDEIADIDLDELRESDELAAAAEAESGEMPEESLDGALDDLDLDAVLEQSAEIEMAEAEDDLEALLAEAEVQSDVPLTQDQIEALDEPAVEAEAPADFDVAMDLNGDAASELPEQEDNTETLNDADVAELDELLDAIESAEPEEMVADAGVDGLLDEAGQDAEQALAAELGDRPAEAAVDQPDRAPAEPEPSFGVAEDVAEAVDITEDADELLDQLMAEVEGVSGDAGPAEADLADSMFDEMVAEAGTNTGSGSVGEKTALEQAEEDMADLIAADLGDLDELGDDPLAGSSVAAADTRGLDEMLDRMEAESGSADILDQEMDGDFSEEVLSEVELDADELNSDLDDMLASLEQEIATEGGDDLASLEAGQVPQAEADSTDALEAQIDDELDALLNSVDDEIEMEEVSAITQEPDFGSDMGLLEGADEVETKLDLARAYIEMEDLEGARDILNEVKQEGSDRQAGEADKLLNEMTA